MSRVSSIHGGSSLPVPAVNPVPLHHKRTSCRACGKHSLEAFLDLGTQPLANAFPATEAAMASEARFPLDVFICETCGLVQLLDVVDPAALFQEYLYVTGTSGTMAGHNRRYARSVHDQLPLSERDLVVEVGSNDGSLLSQFAALGARTLGIEPATNIAAIANERGIDTVNRFFGFNVATELRATRGPAKVVLANNVLAHVDEPVEFLSACREMLAEDGLTVIEVPYARDMLERGEYDTIYHEHLCYFSIGPLSRIASAAGLAIMRADRIPVHGGSLRVWLARGDADAPDVSAQAMEESTLGVTAVGKWKLFGQAAERHRGTMIAYLENLRAKGSRLAGYGAPAKGSTLLNYCGIGPELLPFTVDRNPLKVGRWTPGTHIPVLGVETLRERNPSHVIILPWNLAPEIVQQEQELTARGCRWIVPFPAPREI